MSITLVADEFARASGMRPNSAAMHYQGGHQVLEFEGVHNGKPFRIESEPFHGCPQVKAATLGLSQRGNFMSKLSELANSIDDAVKYVEAEAERALSRLHKARDGAASGITKIDGVSAAIEKSTKDIEDFANRITNGGPPL